MQSMVMFYTHLNPSTVHIMEYVMRKSIKNFLKKTPFYTLYCYIRTYFQTRKVMHNYWRWTEDDERMFLFYQQFICPGDLVFDVGANMGNRTKIFLKLQAQVVAFEPQKCCYEFLRSVLKNNKYVSVIDRALGKEAGKAKMFLSNAHTISSLNPAWIESVKRSGRFSQYKWNDVQTVTVTTLSEMIKVFGLPSFIKIDVEGFEYEVVAGLLQPVKCISIEFTPEFMDSTFQCVNHLSSLSPIEINYSIAESMKLELKDWISADSMKHLVLDIDKHEFGDIYIRDRNA